VLDNSVKFTERGFVKISNYLDEKTGMIIILIKDTGIGIDKVYVNQVFEPFRQESLGYSTSYQGAGLGLPLAKKMSLKLNGDIELESEKGSGTTITLRFPAFTDKIEAKVKTEGSKFMTKLTENPWDKLSVLVVEDDNMNQILYRKLLKKARFLEIAKDGKTALSVVEKQNVNNNFQLVLMDINLPAPWDGISLMKKIRSKWPEYKNIPFIAQTAYAISGNRDVMLEEGFDEYITKPIIKSVLVDAINKVV
jgi:CheY-like chemotaxis protein